MWPIVSGVLYYGWIAVMGAGGVFYLATNREWLKAYRHINFWLFLPAPFILALTIVTANILYKISTPIFGFSWLLLVGQITHQHVNAININLAGTDIPFLGIILVLLLFVQLPAIAELEERWFRKGTRNWVDGSVRSLLFGLVHMVVGIPLGIALGLTIGGLYFTFLYFKGGLDLAARGHFQYNFVALLLLLTYVTALTVQFILR